MNLDCLVQRIWQLLQFCKRPTPALQEWGTRVTGHRRILLEEITDFRLKSMLVVRLHCLRSSGVLHVDD